MSMVQSLTWQIANVVKRSCVIFASLLFFRNSITKLNLMGIFFTLSGVMMYKIAKSRETTDHELNSKNRSNSSEVVDSEDLKIELRKM